MLINVSNPVYIQTFVKSRRIPVHKLETFVFCRHFGDDIRAVGSHLGTKRAIKAYRTLTGNS